jgi:hypothetical protein
MLQNNEHLRGALLVGILRVAKAGWLSGVNNLNVSFLPPYFNSSAHHFSQVYPMGESLEYSTACMFTEEETQMVYNHQNMALPPGKVPGTII